MLKFLHGLFQWPAKVRLTESFKLTDESIIREISDGRSELIEWKDVTKISIATTDQGPFVDDFFYLIQTSSTAMIMPIGWSEKVGLISCLYKRFVGLKEDAILEAAGSVVNAQFVLWESSAAMLVER